MGPTATQELGQEAVPTPPPPSSLTRAAVSDQVHGSPFPPLRDSGVSVRVRREHRGPLPNRTKQSSCGTMPTMHRNCLPATGRWFQVVGKSLISLWMHLSYRISGSQGPAGFLTKDLPPPVSTRVPTSLPLRTTQTTSLRNDKPGDKTVIISTKTRRQTLAGWADFCRTFVKWAFPAV